jgi:glycosyltransferase involved in cell wall biosynthesis
MKKDIIFINSHPIQYFAPMYCYMNDAGVKTICWYCSDESLKEVHDQEFGVSIKWDIPLLQGYEFRFFKNFSWKSSHANGFFGLINLGLIKELFRIKKSVIVVHGWHYFTHLFVLLLARAIGHTVCLRCDVPLSQEKLKQGWKQKLKQFSLRHFVFPRINYFLYIGSQNKFFYKSYGIDDKRLLFCPYAVDNNRFQQQYKSLSKHSHSIRVKLGIPFSTKVIVFSAKYISKKRPLDLLEAFLRLKHKNVWLVMVGEGELRKEMETFIKEHDIRQVILTGFVNQSEISEYYAIGDVFVMCSGVGENWGLSVNEAMNFNLPLILSDLSGCAEDLIKPGINGYVFKTGDIEDLAVKMNKVLFEDRLTNLYSSLDIIADYSYDGVVKNMALLV